MLPAMGGAPIDHLADVETVLEQMGERSGAETDTLTLPKAPAHLGIEEAEAPQALNSFDPCK
jgi:hypothetical protein